MSIQKTPSFKTDDGTVHATLELAQVAEIQKLLSSVALPGHVETAVQDIAQHLVDNREAVLSILSASGRKPRVKKPKRKAKEVAV
jgi:hypothetical protein